MASLSAEGVGHFTCVFPSIADIRVHNDQQLIACGKEVPFSDHQRAVILGPVQSGRRATTSDALQDGRFSLGYSSV